MQRISRAESQVRTRTRIIQAAGELFLRDGYAATSLEAVAAHAGFTRGAVYSNFASKTSLGVAVVDGLYDREIARIVEVTEAARTGGISAVVASIDEWGRGIIGDQAWFRLEMQVSASGAHDGELLKAAASRYDRIRVATAKLLRELEATHELVLPLDADTLALALVSIALGLGMQRATDPSVRTEVVAALAGALLGNVGR